MKSLILAALLFGSIAAHATPGDSLCKATTAEGKKIEVLIGRDSFEQTFAFIDISVNGKKITRFTEKNANSRMVNAGDSENVFMNFLIEGRNADGEMALRFPEQNGMSDASIMATLEFKKAGLSTDELEMSCEF